MKELIEKYKKLFPWFVDFWYYFLMIFLFIILSLIYL